MPWLSIVTPVRDDESGLARTLDSVASQDLDGVEVLVVDSSRNRNAVAAICDDRASVTWVEPEGVFAAMNVGLDQASGTYVQFLNAGDALHDASTLSKVKQLAHQQPAWMFGPVQIISQDGTGTITPSWDYETERRHLFARGHFPQHQGTFVQRALLQQLGGFSLSYRVAADYAMSLRLAQIASPVVAGFVVADFYEGGLSSVRWRESFREFHQARLEIFRPKGLPRLQEQWDYRLHVARVGAYRKVVAPLMRLARL